MMDGLKERIKKILCPDKIEGLFCEDDVVSDEVVEYIRGLNFQKDRLCKLFKGKSVGKRKQKIEVKCCMCGEKWVKVMGMVEVCCYINKKSGLCFCDVCKLVEDNKKKMENEKREEEWKKIKEENTKRYIEMFLDPQKSWKKSIKNWEKMSDLYDGPIDKERVAEYIQEMNYQDFLKTPYWVAIAEKIKKRNDFRCELCGERTKELNVHHPGYEFHGYELQNISKLKCLCQRCHNKFHNIGE